MCLHCSNQSKILRMALNRHELARYRRQRKQEFVDTVDYI